VQLRKTLRVSFGSICRHVGTSVAPVCLVPRPLSRPRPAIRTVGDAEWPNVEARASTRRVEPVSHL